MTIDFWGLGLQAVNVLILVWLLSWVFWRPVAAAIAKRQESAKAVMETAQATQAQADAAMAEVTQTREGIAAERSAILDKARAEAEVATKVILDEARGKAGAMLAAAKTTIAQNAGAARKSNAAQATDLSLTIAEKLLERLSGPVVQSAFLSQLIEAIGKMPAADRAALVDNPKGIEVITASDTGTERKKIENEIRKALGGTPVLRFTIDSNLIAGLELRSPHFALHNSWRADLTQIRKAVQDAV